ncbi:MAG: alpha/beta hydrolase [Burkholderiaceae bacterium]|nr:alpha/beta hydrolase [Burkholderiaceae bacterium]
MTAVYRGMDQAALDAGYNNTLAVHNSAELMAGYGVLSEQMRQSPDAKIGLRYGPAPRNLIDYLPAAEPGPLLVFIHGGYWQARAKEDFTFLARGPLALGMHVALVGYTLAPEATLATIAREVRASIGWLRAQAGAWGADTDRIVVSGWSAGGHLTAMCMEEPGVIAGLAISGVYDLEPVRLSYLNAKLKLAGPDVKPMSPALLPPVARSMTIAYGTAELPELQRQSREFFAMRQPAGAPGALLPLDGRHHFTVLEDLASPQGALALAARQLGTLNPSAGTPARAR